VSVGKLSERKKTGKKERSNNKQTSDAGPIYGKKKWRRSRVRESKLYVLIVTKEKRVTNKNESLTDRREVAASPIGGVKIQRT